MDKVLFLAKQLQDRKLCAADLQKQSISRNKLFLVAYAQYLLGLTNENTRTHYKTIVDHFIRYMANLKSTTPLDATGIDVSLWQDDLKRTGGVAGAPPNSNLDRYFPHEKASLSNKREILSAFYRFLQKPGMDGSPPLVPYNPVDALPDRITVEKYGRSKKIDRNILHKILDQIDTTSIKGLRDYVLIYGYFVTGRRNSEWITLKWGQINKHSTPPTYTFIRKGQITTTDELPQKLFGLLKIYLQARYDEDFESKIDANTYLFTAMPGRGGARQILNPNNPLDERTMLSIIKEYAKIAQIDPKRITVHSLRHLHAETYLEAGASVEEVRARLRHASLATTQRYISSMSNEKNRLASKLDDLLEEEKST